MNRILFLSVSLLLMWAGSNAQIVLQENFNGTTLPTNWTNTSASTGFWIFSTGPGFGVSGTQDHTGSGGNYAWIDFSGTDDINVTLTAPAVDVSALTTPYLEFAYESYYTGTNANFLFNLVMVQAWNGSSWDTVSSLQGNTAQGWEVLGYDLSTNTYASGDSVRVRFVGETGGDGFDYENDLLIDDVVIKEAPTCFTPSSPNATSITTTSANLGWTANGNNTPAVTQWQISYGGSGFTAGSGTQVMTSTNPHNLTGLSSNTTYDWYVRSVCGAGDTSTWSPSNTFSTPCSPYTLPYSEGFESGFTHNTAVGGCLSQESVIGTQTWTTNTGAITANNRTARTGSASAFLRYTNTDWLFIPVTLTGGVSYTAEVYAKQDGTTTTNSDVGISYGSTNDADSMTNTVVSPVGIDDSYQLIQGTFTPGSSGTYYIGIKGYMNGSPWYITIDDIKVYATPNCLAPTALSTSSLTTTSANLSWTENNTPAVTQWVVSYGASGVSASAGTWINTSTNPHSLTGLSANTTYDYYVRSICGAGDTSSWAGPASFTTPCNPYTLPYFEGFESGFTHNAAVGGCLSQEIVTGNQTWTANTGAISDRNRTPRTGTSSTFLRYGNEDWLFIPVTLVGGTNYTAEVYAKQDGTGLTNSDVGISYGTTNTAAGMTNTIVSSVGIDDQYQLIKGSFTPPSSGTYYIGIKGYMNGSPWYITMDDISIYATPTADFGVRTIFATSGDCGADSSEVRVEVYNFGIAAQTNVSVTAEVSGAVTATVSNTIASLAPFTADTIVLGTINTRAGGTVNFKSFTALAGDQKNDNDTIELNGIDYGAIPATPSVDSIAICRGIDTIIRASLGANYRWYDQAVGGTLLSSTDSLNVTNASANDTFYVEAYNQVSETFGATTAPTGGFITAATGWGVGFNVNSSSVIIDSVTIYPTGTGTITIHVSNYAGVPIMSSAPITISGASLTKMRVPVGLTVPAGMYKMTMSYTGITSLGRNSGHSFPLTSSGGEVTILGGSTGTGNPTSTNNYWFYDFGITVAGCPSDRAVSTMSVDLGSGVASTRLPEYCDGDDSDTLRFATVPGGTYTGTAVKNGVFVPDSGMVGQNEIVYQVPSLIGCIDTIVRNITIHALPTLSLSTPSMTCIGDDTLKLRTGLPVGGTYTVNGNVDSLILSNNPRVDTVLYAYTDTNTCSNSIERLVSVNSNPVVAFAPITPACDGDSVVILNQGTPTGAGGVYFGSNNIINGNYFPTRVINDTLHYLYVDSNNCTDTATQVLAVNALPTVMFGNLTGICKNAPIVALSGGSPAGGTYSGNSVTGANFDPASANAQELITYTFTDANNCVNSDTSTIQVFDVPNVRINIVSDICKDDGLVQISGASPSGGTYSGSGVVGTDSVNTAVLAVGNHPISYSFTDANNCTDSNATTFDILANPNFSISGILEGCGDSIPELTTSLSGASYNIKWSNGVQGNIAQFTTTGQAWAKVTDVTTPQRCASYDTTDVVYSELCVGLEEFTLITDVNVYPNPNSGTFTIELNNVNESSVTINVISASGQLVYSSIKEINGQQLVTEVSLETVETGIYFVRIQGKTSATVQRVTVSE